MFKYQREADAHTHAILEVSWMNVSGQELFDAADTVS